MVSARFRYFTKGSLNICAIKYANLDYSPACTKLICIGCKLQKPVYTVQTTKQQLAGVIIFSS